MDIKPKTAHAWDVSPKQAIAIQAELVGRVREEPLGAPVETVAGIDVSIRGDVAQAAIVVVALPALDVVDEAIYRGAVPFPYVPGLLSFREVPMILPAMEQLSVVPDVLMLDAHGRAHPRRFGLACHLGLLLDRPSVGVAKSRLTGEHEEPGPEKGDRSPLVDGDEIVGVVLRTRARVKPVFVSVGHRVTLDDAVRLTLACTGRFKLPEPTRMAHHLSRKAD